MKGLTTLLIDKDCLEVGVPVRCYGIGTNRCYVSIRNVICCQHVRVLNALESMIGLRPDKTTVILVLKFLDVVDVDQSIRLLLNLCTEENVILSGLLKSQLPLAVVISTEGGHAHVVHFLKVQIVLIHDGLGNLRWDQSEGAPDLLVVNPYQFACEVVAVPHVRVSHRTGHGELGPIPSSTDTFGDLN